MWLWPSVAVPATLEVVQLGPLGGLAPGAVNLLLLWVEP